VTNLIQPTHPALEAAIQECAEAAKDMESLEYRIEMRVAYTEAWAVRVEIRWRRSLVALTAAAKLAGKNTEGRNRCVSILHPDSL
jgi:hypothetical protein